MRLSARASTGRPYRRDPSLGSGSIATAASSTTRYIRGDVKPGRFFDGRVDTIVVHAAGKKVENKPALGEDRTATIDWKITFHRIEKDQ